MNEKTPLTDDEKQLLLTAAFCVASCGDPDATIDNDTAEGTISLLCELAGFDPNVLPASRPRLRLVGTGAALAPREGCNYVTAPGAMCRKCWRVHGTAAAEPAKPSLPEWTDFEDGWQKRYLEVQEARKAAGATDWKARALEAEDTVSQLNAALRREVEGTPDGQPVRASGEPSVRAPVEPVGTAAPAETAPQPDRDPFASKSHDVARYALQEIEDACPECGVRYGYHDTSCEAFAAHEAAPPAAVPAARVDYALRAHEAALVSALPEDAPGQPTVAHTLQELKQVIAANEAAQQDAWDAPAADPISDEAQTALYKMAEGTPYYSDLRKLYRLASAQPPAVESGPSEAALRDAERYRWIKHSATLGEYPPGAPNIPFNFYGIGWVRVDGLDAAIDAAIAASKETTR